MGSGRRGSKDGGAGNLASNNAKGSGGKGSKKGRENSGNGKASRPQNNAESTEFTQSDRNMMKKITIVAQLDKVPKPPAAIDAASSSTVIGKVNANSSPQMSVP